MRNFPFIWFLSAFLIVQAEKPEKRNEPIRRARKDNIQNYLKKLNDSWKETSGLSSSYAQDIL